MNDETCRLIQRTLGIDITDPRTRQRAWQRLHVFREIAAECDRDGSAATGAMLRTICQRAICASDDDDRLVYLALLAGLDGDR